MAFTFFFRDLQILELAVKHTTPLAMGKSRTKIWDAGCAMGPEPYSLAILFAETMGYFGFKNLNIYATDMDETDTFGRILQDGAYSGEETKRIPAEILGKYFKPAGNEGNFRIVDAVRERIFFHKHDLLSLEPIGYDFSLIICKNVLLHFQPQERVEVLKMFHKSLSPGGYLATEQTQKIPGEIGGLFEQVAFDGQIFRKVGV